MGDAASPDTSVFSIEARVSSVLVVTEAAPTSDRLVVLPLERLAEIPVATAVRSPDLSACTTRLPLWSARSLMWLSTMRAVVSSSDFWIATAPAMAAVNFVDAFWDNDNAPPPATLTCVRSDSARTATVLVPVSMARTTAPSTRAVVSRSLKLVTMAPAPAMEKLGGLLAAGSSAAALSVPSPLAGALAPSRGAMVDALPSSWACSSADLAPALPARLSPVLGLSGASGSGFSPAVAPATPTATTMPSVRACTRSAPVSIAPAVPSAVLASPPSVSLSPT